MQNLFTRKSPISWFVDTNPHEILKYCLHKNWIHLYLYAAIVNGFQLLTIFEKSSILNVAGFLDPHSIKFTPVAYQNKSWFQTRNMVIHVYLLSLKKVFKKTREASLVEVTFPIFSGNFGKNLPKVWQTNLQ